ncbi:MAG: zinc-ribbon domain-containing transport protein [Bacteroidales bacterium]|nr:zinc-ribbon domain-containing transport protein [Bacteroidales bacterium]
MIIILAAIIGLVIRSLVIKAGRAVNNALNSGVSQLARAAVKAAVNPNDTGFQGNVSSANYGDGASAPNNDVQIAAALCQNDPNFSSGKFIGWAKEEFITLQQAFTGNNAERLRAFETDELFAEHSSRIQEFINNNQMSVRERVNVNQAYLTLLKQDAQYEQLTVYLAARMAEYVLNASTKQLVSGLPTMDRHSKFLLTFRRARGSKTAEAVGGQQSVSCPKCGAPVQITSSGKCEYCGHIITDKSHGWALSDIERISGSTSIDYRGVVVD